ncbi:hypothetical protein P9112_000297 [Eukaryota sp. TZLM1-RC]
MVPSTPPTTSSINTQPSVQPTPSMVSSSQSAFSGILDTNLLLSSMVGSRDRDNRPKRLTSDAIDLRDVDKLLKLVNKFILWRTKRYMQQ